MKTVKFISALSLAIILLAATSSYAKKPDNNKVPGSVSTVRYEVNVHFSSDKPLCNFYQVQMLDANGNLVATPQAFIQGKTTYSFYEQTHVSAAIRIARMILTPNIDRFVCSEDLSVTPVAKLINFVEHSTYVFDLVPTSSATKDTK